MGDTFGERARAIDAELLPKLREADDAEVAAQRARVDLEAEYERRYTELDNELGGGVDQ